MDNVPNAVMETTPPPVPQSAPQTIQEATPRPKKKVGLVVLVIFLSLIVVGLLVYIAYEKEYIQIPFLSKTNSSANTEEDANNDNGDAAQADGEEETATTTAFAGDTFTASLPEGWTMQEYYDGQGTEYLSDGPDYVGLTGLKLFNPDGVQMFYLAGVNGIGFAGCSEYYAFADDNPAYRAEAQASADEMGDTMNINDFSNMPYAEYEVLGRTVRRIATKIYLDDEEGNNFFEAPCFNVVVTFEGLSYTDADSYPYQAYFYGFNTTITGDELLQVDSILESLS
ncbi:hypothetical protein KKA50_03170, partial [Patescibacteria group bacterium]|nr:hypothetical protein [Patescibacteria group bacterium]